MNVINIRNSFPFLWKGLRVGLFALLTLTACDKNDDDSPQDPVSQLPPETTTGENTFGFVLNGEPFNITNTSNQFAIYQNGFLQFGAAGITIIIIDPINENFNYDLVQTSSNQAKCRFAIESQDGSLCVYDYEDTILGSLTFTNIDDNNFIISGTFEFSTNNEECENIDITNGRFDLQYIP
ncbi:hypothetical protein LX97_01345 [Nonlabens dokdonensis]|jgi:hypothetical protein|uniref:Lipoprotein n=2 Tax=Nonlabens dokdonensis TaxID=328515 RepID=L7WA17_NONDD|nr:hypothetical protein [Nonlabens dokdonensis]AGC76686.1 hypothetical protein DDD_1559 [Nonlabens dokdonensis DSW-6]PZX44334.1 hypothetical protein LX97_01345 [Nonlabens dokdonensis]